MATIIVLALLNALSLSSAVVIYYLSMKERSKLLDRIMASSYVEYKAQETPEPNNFSPKEDQLIDITDARGLMEEE